MPPTARWLLGLAVLAQLLMPVVGAARAVLGETMVICTAQGFRTVAIDPATPGEPAEHHRCDLCCVACCGTARAAAAWLIIHPSDYGNAGPPPLVELPAPRAPRHQRPPGRAPPAHLV